MIHGFNNTFLYTAYKIDICFADEIGNTKKGTGTCFFVVDKKNELHLFTNRHVIDLTYKKSEVEKMELSEFKIFSISISGKYAGSQDLYPREHITLEIDFESSGFIYPENEDEDVVDLFPHFLKTTHHTIDTKLDYGIAYSLLADTTIFDNCLSIADFVAFVGFPNGYDKADNRPILRSGVVSSDPRFDYYYNDTIRGRCLAYEAFSFGGSSGSPVFALVQISPSTQKVLLIGINAGHIDNQQQHSGLSYLYKSNIILELIDKANR